MLWLVTGCSSGLGLALVEAILKLPDQKVIATSRTSASSEIIQRTSSGQNVSWELLNVTSDNLETDLAAIISKYGHIDVLINNAGYAMGGAFESLPLTSIRQQYETNFFGPVRLMQAVIPLMRQRKSSTIVNISSAEAWDPHPGASVYASSKWALEGLSQAVAGEVARFGMRVMIVQPGGMRTNFIDPKKAAGSLVPMPEAYKGTMVDYVLQAITSSHGVQNLDPKLSAEAIVKEVLEPTLVDEKMILRLPLGAECLQHMEGQAERVKKDFDALRPQALACDFTA